MGCLSSAHLAHQREERRDDRGVDVVLLRGAHRRKAVDLVEEDDRRLQTRRLLRADMARVKSGEWGAVRARAEGS